MSYASSYAAFHRTGDYAKFPGEVRAAGPCDVNAVLAHQDTHQFTDPASEERVVGLTLGGRAAASWGIASRWRQVRARTVGTIGISPVGEAVEFDVVGPHSVLAIAFPTEAVDQVAASCAFDAHSALQDAHVQYWYDARVEPILLMLWDALAARDSVASILVESLTQAAIAALAAMAARERRPIRPHGRVANPLKDDRLEAFVRENIHRRITVADLARAMEQPKRDFARDFTATTGFGPYEFVQRVRLRMCKDMLANPRVSIGEIATALGFADQSHLGRFVRSRTGYAPSVYRARSR